MRPNDIARSWLGTRPLAVVVCGAPGLGKLLMDDQVNVYCARTMGELAVLRSAVALDVAVIAEAPWPGGDALKIARDIRTEGVGTVLLTRSQGTAQKWLRERMAVELASPDLHQKLMESVWFAVCETEIVRRSRAGSPAALVEGEPARPRYVASKSGGLEASMSTMTYVFGDLDLNEPQSKLLAPPIPKPVEQPSMSKTVAFQPSESVLRSLREDAHREQHAGTKLAAIVLVSALAFLGLTILGLRFL